MSTSEQWSGEDKRDIALRLGRDLPLPAGTPKSILAAARKLLADAKLDMAERDLSLFDSVMRRAELPARK